MTAVDRPAQRAKLLAELYFQADGTVTGTLNVDEAGIAVAFVPEQTRAAVAFLAEEGLIERHPGGEGSYRLTTTGIRAVEEPASVQDSGGINVGILNSFNNFGQIAGRDNSQRFSTNHPRENPRGFFKRPWIIGVGGSLIAAGILAFLSLILRSDDPTTMATLQETMCPASFTPDTGAGAVIGVDPSSAGPGTPITVNGGGFKVGDNVTVTLSRVIGSTTVVVTAGSRSTSIAGSLIPWRIEVPKTAVKGEKYIVKAAGPGGGCATAQITVT